MNSRKILIYIALGMVSWLLVSSWQEFQKVQADKNSEGKGVVANVVEPLPEVKPSDLVTLKAQDQIVMIDRKGGKIVQTYLNRYDLKKGSKEKVHVFSKDPTHQLYAASGFTGDADLVFSVLRKDKSLLVLTATAPNGIEYKKEFKVEKDYTISVTTYVKNQTKKDWLGQAYSDFTGNNVTSIGKDKKLPEPNKFIAGESGLSKKSGFLGVSTYTGAAYYSEKTPYTKLTYEEMAGNGVNKKLKNTWIALQKRYFLGAIVPQKDQTYEIVSHWKSGYLGRSTSHYSEQFNLRLLATPQTIGPNEEASFNAVIYSGPEIVNILSKISPGLDQTIDYGMLWFISQAVFYLMEHINKVIHNWGFTIILSTVFIRLLFYRFQDAGNRSMEKMKMIAPKIEAIQSQYADDPEAKNTAILALYKKEKVNPIGGCLPLIVQIPFYFATYHVVMEAVQIRHQPFLWIKDLSATDPYYILPVVLGVAMFVQTKMTPASPDPAQENMKLILPVILMFVFISMPAGVSLYILTSTLFGVLQQQITSKKLKASW